MIYGDLMTSSFLGRRIRRTSELLKLGAAERVSEYERRFGSLTDLYDRLLSSFIISSFSYERGYETALKFFGSSKIRFAGIDGTMYSNPLYDLMIFFGGAYAATGTIAFNREAKPKVEYDSKFLEGGAGISSVVPIYINEVPDVDQTFFDYEEPGEISISKPLVDQTIINNATIANWIMTFAEYYLAYKLITDSQKQIRILLMDRTLSGERTSLLYDTSKRELWKVKANIIGYEVDGVPIDINDLAYGRYYIREPVLGLPPARADYLRYAIIYLVQDRGPLTINEICQELEIKDEKRRNRIERYLKSSVREKYLKKIDSRYECNPRYVATWDRIKKLVTLLGERIFFEEENEEGTSNKMKIVKQNKEHWLTTLDIAFLTLFCLQMLIEECWKRKVLLIGLTKDTAARDFKRQLIPILSNEGLLETSVTPEEMEELPNTDRMILQSASLNNPEKVKVPWSLVEYDSCFKTMIPDKKHRKGYVHGARRNRISLEKLFLKTYIQLSQASHDHLLRSNVLLTDRLVHPEFDVTEKSTISFWNEFGSAKEPLEVLLFKDQTVENPLQNLIMIILKSMTTPSIPEAFGHNKPLFIADKVAKWHYGAFKRVVDSTRQWILNNHKLRKFVFYMSTFRERRARIEAARREIL
jgi:DNA-binding Lrp family transcriptional regulator